MTELSDLIKEEHREIYRRTTMREDFGMTIEEIEESQDFKFCFSLNAEKTKLKVEVCSSRKKKKYEVSLTQEERDAYINIATRILKEGKYNCKEW